MVYRPTGRVLTVLELLQTHGQLTGVELSRRLEVDARTVRRYVTTLQDMGVPIESEPGRYGGYALRPGYKLPPLMFNDDEVLMLTLGLLMARRSGVAGAGAAVESALAKIERVLPLNLRDQHRALKKAWLMDEDDDDERLVESDLVATFTLAAEQKRQVRLIYEGTDGDTERVIDPYGVVLDKRWYVVGYCHLRTGIRIFRLDRVSHAEMLMRDRQMPPPDNFDALDYLLTSFESIRDRWDVEVRVQMPVKEVRRKIPKAYAALHAEGEGTRLRASIDDLDTMARVLIGLGCPLEIVSPPELRTAFLTIAEEITRVAKPSP